MLSTSDKAETQDVGPSLRAKIPKSPQPASAGSKPAGLAAAAKGSWLDRETALSLAMALAVLGFYTVLVWTQGPPSAREAASSRATADAAARP